MKDIKKLAPYIFLSAILSAILTLYLRVNVFYSVNIYYMVIYFCVITAFITLLTQKISFRAPEFIKHKNRIEKRNAEIVLNNLKESGIFVMPLEEVSNIWSEGSQNKENVVPIDMSKMYYIWRDIYAIDKHKTRGLSYKNEEIRKFFQTIYDLFHKRLENKKSDTEYMSFQAEYRVIIFLLDFLDQHGHCSSVVQNNKGEFRSGEPDSFKNLTKFNMKKDENITTDYEMLKHITLTQHSLHVADIIIKLITKKEKEIYQKFMLPSAIIAALAHDIGKIPDFYNSSRYTMMLHPSISAELLEKFINGPDNIKDTILKEKLDIINFAIKKHHTGTINRTQTDGKILSLYDYLVDADKQAREEEKEMISRKIGMYIMNEKEKETTKENIEKGEVVKKDVEEVVNSMQLNNFKSAIKENAAKENKIKSQEQTQNNNSNTKQQNSISFKYSDFDELLKIKPVDYNFNIAFKKENYTINWLTEEIMYSMLEIIEERINYVHNDGVHDIYFYNIFNVKDVLFITTNVITSLLYYFGRNYGDNILDMEKQIRTQTAITLVNSFQDIGVIATNQKKENYMGGWFDLTFSDYEGKNAKNVKAYYTPFDLNKIAEIFYKNAEDYELRKKDKRYDPVGVLSKIRSFKWAPSKKT